MSKINIAISGKMAVGKTELANYLCEHYGYEKYAFAQPMKELELIHQRFKKEDMSLSELILLLEPYISDLDLPAVKATKELLSLYQETPLVMPKNREFLQKLGTEVVRKYNDNAWVNYAINHVKKMDKPVIIDDVRFLNEADALLKEDFFLVRVTAEENIRLNVIEKLYGKEALDPSRLNHTSETQLDNYKDFNLTFHNNYDDRLSSYADALMICLSNIGR